jgi:hypothetical protein
MRLIKIRGVRGGGSFLLSRLKKKSVSLKKDQKRDLLSQANAIPGICTTCGDFPRHLSDKRYTMIVSERFGTKGN